MSQPNDGLLANVSTKTILLIGAAILTPGVGYLAHLIASAPRSGVVTIGAEAPQAAPNHTQAATARPATPAATTTPVATTARAPAVAVAPPAHSAETKPATEATAPASAPGPGTLLGAIDAAKPNMEDTRNKMDAGTVQLTKWLLANGQWSQFASVPETSAAKVKKDPDEERGKRLCGSGSIIQIESEKIPEGKLYTGILSTMEGHIFSFVAVRSTGDLVAHSAARFCGIVTGRHSYDNSGGGTSHGVRVVGMFDLPENKKKTP